MSSSVLLIVDIQSDYFPGGAFPLPHMEAAARVAAKALKFFREHAQPVVHIRHVELDPEATFFVAGTAGVEIYPTVAPLETELTIEKNFPNSFRNTNLRDELQRLGVTQLVVCGAMSNMCIDATARAAVDYGFECTLLSDACAASDLEFEDLSVPASQVHAAFMAAYASAYGPVMSFGQFVEAG